MRRRPATQHITTAPMELTRSGGHLGLPLAVLPVRSQASIGKTNCLLRWSFSRSFHRPQLKLTRPDSPETPPNLTWPDPTEPERTEDWQLSPKQQVAGSSPARGTKRPSSQVRRVRQPSREGRHPRPRHCTALDDLNNASWLKHRSPGLGALNACFHATEFMGENSSGP
jgi:hypothetical protein